MTYHTDYMTAGEPDCPHAVWEVDKHEQSHCAACGAVKEVIMTARVEALRAALYEVLDAECCGCSVYGEIAAEALGIDFKEYGRASASASTGGVK